MAHSSFSITGQMVYARSTDSVPVTITFPEGYDIDQLVDIQIGNAMTTDIVTEISPPEGRAKRILTLSNGNKIFVDAQSFPAILNRSKWATTIDRAEKAPLFWLVLASLFSAVIVGIAAYIFVPTLSDRLARYIPDEVITQLSDATLANLDAVLLSDSALSQSRQDQITQAYLAMLSVSDAPNDVELLFRSSSVLGANALALPGGPIILLDELVEIAPSDDAILGVLAHEVAHVALAHNRKHIAREGVVALLISLIGFSTDGGIGAGIAANLISSGHSREFETQADQLARQWLVEAGTDLTEFDEMLRVLYETRCKDHCDEVATGWFDTHPSLSDRLAIKP